MRKLGRSTCIWCLFLSVTGTTVTCQARKQSLGRDQLTQAKQDKGKAPDRDLNGAVAVLKVYLDLEEGQKYDKIYALLSARRKKYLERFKVRTAEQYRELRESSEASWTGFRIEGKTAEGDDKVTITGNARIEESGEVRQVSFKCTLVWESDIWKVDDWKY